MLFNLFANKKVIKDCETSTITHKKLGIIAGGGSIPKKLIDYCIAENIPYYLLGISGNAIEKDFESVSCKSFIRIGQAGSGFATLKAEGVEQIVLIGTINRPTFAELVPDIKTAAFFAKLGAKSLGDDGILRALINEIEADGMQVIGIHEVMPQLLAPLGCLTKRKPDADDKEDIKRGVEVALNLGLLDVGQSVVVQNGLVLGLEGIEGTDRLISRCKDYKRKGKLPVLTKLRKPKQEMRADLPTIGIKTIEQAYNSGFAGIAVHANNTLMVDKEEIVALANKYKMFIIGINPEEYK